MSLKQSSSGKTGPNDPPSPATFPPAGPPAYPGTSSGCAALGFSLQGRTALVTGAGRGLGFAIARGFGRAGAQVFLNDVRSEATDAACAKLRAEGLAAEPAPFDVTDQDAAAKAIDGLVDRYGRLDILMNNAGILVRKPIETHDLEAWNRVLSVNLTGMYAVAREAVRPMRAAGYGRIINTASLMAVTSRPGVISYVAAKHGVLGITRALASELGAEGITVNAIGPGYVETEMNTATLADQTFYQQVLNHTPIGRWAKPDDLVGPAVFLASEASGYVTGQLLMVDGGMTATIFQTAPQDLGDAA